MTRGEVRDRADFYYHRPEFEIEAKRIKQTPYQLVKLGTLCDKVTDGTHFTPTYTESGVPFISVKDVREFQISFKDTKFVSEEEHLILSKRCNPKPGDILLTKVGTIGLAAVIPDDAPEFDLFVSVCLLKFKNKQQSNFVCSVLNSPIAQLQFLRELKGIGVPDLHLENIRDILIPLPPLEIQAQLVAEMEAARQQRGDDLARADALLGGVDEWLLAQLGLTPPALDTRSSFAVTLGTLSADKRISPSYYHPERITAIRNQKQNTNLRSESLADIADFMRDQKIIGDEFYLGLANVASNSGELVESTEEVAGAVFRFQRDDVLFARLRPYLNKVHRAERDGVCSTEFYVLRMRDASNPSDKVLPDYLATILRSSLTLAQTRHMMTGNTHPRLANEDVTNLVVPIPPLALQHTIAAEVRRRRDEARQLREKAESAWGSAKARFEAQLLGGQP